MTEGRKIVHGMPDCSTACSAAHLAAK